MSLKVLSTFLLLSLIGVGAQDFYCPGQTVELTCREALILKWQGSAFTGQCPSDGDVISYTNIPTLTQSDVGNTTTCGVFTANITSLEPDSVTGALIAEITLSFTAALPLNGLTIQCEDAESTNPLDLDVLLTIPETTTPALFVDQVSQDSVNINFTLSDNRCVSSYNVNATEADDNTTTTRHSGTMSPVTVNGLDICQNDYSFVGYVTEQNGEQSNVSMQVDFMIEFSVINPITVTVNSPPQEPILLWMHDVTPMYTTCITEFLVTSDVNNNTFNTTTIGPNVRQLTTEQLNSAGFEYCVPLRPVVTPITGMGPLTLRSAMGGDTYLLDPDFPTPMLSYSFSLRPANETLNETEDTVTLRVTIQSVSNTMVPVRTFQYNIDAGQLSNETSFTGDYFEIDLGGAEGGEVVGVTVNFQDRECRTTASADYTVPMRNISNVQLGVATNISQTVTITLPVTPQEPSDLEIISTIVPADSGPYMDSYPGHGSQYTVMFTDLNPDTEYTCTIRIVVRADDTEVAAITEDFMTLPTPTTEAPTTTEPTTTPTELPPPTPAPSACGTGCIVGIIIAVIVFVVIVIVIIIVLLVIRSKKRSGSMKVTSAHEMEQQHKLAPTNGEEPGSPVKDEPATSGTFKTDGTSPGDQADSGNGATGGEGADQAALIYADLDIAKKSKPKDPDTPTGAAVTGGEESVHYATIDHLKKDEGAEAEGTS